MGNLVLSVFPGIDLLGRAFEEEGHDRLITLAWAAAVIDSEGCLSIRKGRQSSYDAPYYAVDVIVSNTNREFLVPFLSIFGGRIDNNRKPTENRRAGYQWKATGSHHSSDVLKAVQPFLIAKRKQATVALRACELLRRTGYRRAEGQLEELESLKQEMHRLNARGNNG